MDRENVFRVVRRGAVLLSVLVLTGLVFGLYEPARGQGSGSSLASPYQSAEAETSTDLASGRYTIKGQSGEHGSPEPSNFELEIVDRLRTEKLDEIYVLDYFVRSLRGGAGTTIIRVKEGRARLTVLEGGDSRRERWLDAEELGKLREFIETRQVDQLPGLHNGGLSSHPTFWTYLHLTADGGWRVLADDPNWAGENGAPYRDLIGVFEEIGARPAPRVHGIAEKYSGRTVFQGTEREFAYQLLDVGGVPTIGCLRHTVVKGQIDYMAPRTYSWYKLGESGLKQIDDTKEDLPSEWHSVSGQIGVNWLARQPDGWDIRETSVGIARCKDGKTEVILPGEESLYGGPIVSPDGRWAIVERRIGPHWAVPNEIIRLNLLTGEAHSVSLEPDDNLSPIAYLDYHQSFLIRRGDSYHLLDPETGEHRKVEGEFRPWISYGLRPYQATQDEHVVWACVSEFLKEPTTVGLYDLRTFTFRPVYYLEEDFEHHEFLMTEEDLLLKRKGDVVALPRARLKRLES